MEGITMNARWIGGIALLLLLFMVACAPKPMPPKEAPAAEQQVGAIEQDLAELDKLSAELDVTELNDIDAALGELEELPLD